MPASLAWCGVSRCISVPQYLIVPVSGLCTPEIVLIKVDLPAPLSPAKARTSPGLRVNDTSLSACRPPKRFEICSRSSSGSLLEAFITLFPRAFLNLIDEYGDNDHHTDRHKLPEWFHIHKNQAVLNYCNDQRADDRADDRS